MCRVCRVYDFQFLLVEFRWHFYSVVHLIFKQVDLHVKYRKHNNSLGFVEMKDDWFNSHMHIIYYRLHTREIILLVATVLEIHKLQ